MADQLYLLEILIESIFFETSPVPQRKQIYIEANVKDIAILEIRSDATPTGGEGSSRSTTMEFNAGKSYLFAASPNKLLDNLGRYSMEIALYKRGDTAPVGMCNSSWDISFLDMIKESMKSAGYITPVSIADTFPMIPPGSSDPIANVNAYIRLSCFGTNIQTQFQVNSESKDGGPAETEYLFKTANAATTFSCKKYGVGTSGEILPIAPLFGAATIKSGGGGGGGIKAFSEGGAAAGPDQIQSVMALFDNFTLSAKESMLPFEFQFPEHFTKEEKERFSMMTMSILSMQQRPQENKFMDFLAGIKWGDKVEGDEDEGELSSMGRFLKAPSDMTPAATAAHGAPAAIVLTPKEREKILQDTISRGAPITEEVINQLLCGRKDCPAARKFREYGLGPLAPTGAGRGMAGGEVKNICPYGMSQTYGTFDLYGPYGAYMEPQKPEQPYVGKTVMDELWRRPEPPTMKNCCAVCNSRKSAPANRKQRKCPDSSCPLRLRGGGVITSDIMRPETSCKKRHSRIVDVEQLTARAQKFDIEANSSDYRSVKSKSKKKSKREKQRIYSPYLNEYKRSRYYSKGINRITSLYHMGKYAHNKKKKVSKEKKKHDIYLHDLQLYQDGEAQRLALVNKLKEHFDEFHSKSCCPGCQRKVEQKNSKNSTGVYVHDSPQSRVTEKYDPHREEHLRCKSNYKNLINKAINLRKFLRTSRSTISESDENNKSEDAVSVTGVNSKIPLRLRGGQPTGEGFKSPFLECKEIIDQFDKILGEYKRALGPCGQPTCPYAGNVAAENCKAKCPMQLLCRAEVDNTFNTPPPPSTYNACGSPSCPYKQYKTGLTSDDAELEAQFLPPAIAENCGHPRCPYQSEVAPLPPIHWDCPDPLPSGPCKNPQCPFLPKELKTLADLTRNKASCGSPHCPYVMPAACESEKCPFKPQACPIEGHRCDNPACPFAKDDRYCDNPDCPMNKRDSNEDYCANPDCPAAQEAKKQTCSRKSCPFLEPSEECPCEASTAGTTESDICDPRTCPLLKPPVIQPCDDPNCPFNIGWSSKTDQSETRASAHPLSSGPPPPPPPKASVAGAVVTAGGGDAKKQEKPIQSAPIICTRDTCAATEGGLYICAECNKGANRGKRYTPYIYSLGDKYPGIKIGHRDCITPCSNVPPKMGWLWNIHTPCLSLKPRRGWRPGAITKTVAQRIVEYHKKKRQPLSPMMKKMLEKKKGAGEGEDSDTPVAPKPTLQIKKRDGCYYITMNPLKDPNTLEDNENPYMDCTPMQFKITKNKKNVCLKKVGETEYKTCIRGEDDECCTGPSSSSSDSELDIEFTPPAGIIHPERLKKKRNVIHTNTQYDPVDYIQINKPKSNNKLGKQKSRSNTRLGGKGKKK